MLSVGLAYRLRLIVGPLREARAVFRELVANFVLVPLLAVGIERMIPMDPPPALGLFLLAGSAGAPFLIKLASAARSDQALSAALLLLLVPVTVVVPSVLRTIGNGPSFSARSVVCSLEHRRDRAPSVVNVDPSDRLRSYSEGCRTVLVGATRPDQSQAGNSRARNRHRLDLCVRFSRADWDT